MLYLYVTCVHTYILYPGSRVESTRVPEEPTATCTGIYFYKICILISSLWPQGQVGYR